MPIVNHRPGPGSCTPNWGTTATAIARRSSEARPLRVALRHTPDPVALGLAPGPVTGWMTRSTLESTPAMRPGDRCGPTTESTTN